MTVQESFLIALFCMAGVFLVLVSLFALIKLFSFLLESVSTKEKLKPVADRIQTIPTQNDIVSSNEDFSSGTVRLKNVDEPTAAMIMAIVSDESGIPLSELCFKSISLVQQD